MVVIIFALGCRLSISIVSLSISVSSFVFAQKRETVESRAKGTSTMRLLYCAHYLAQVNEKKKKGGTYVPQESG